MKYKPWLAYLGIFALVVALFSHITYEERDSVRDKALEQTVRDRIVTVTNKEGTSGGTGFRVKLPSGNTGLLTNRHICEIADVNGMLWVKTEYNDRAVPVHVREKSDTSTDLCLLDDIAGKSAFELGSSAEVGEQLYSSGHPGLSPLKMVKGELVGIGDLTVVIGLSVSSDDCNLSGQHVIPSLFGNFCAQDYHGEYLTTLKAFPGDSGSPVFDSNGKLVGVIFCSGEPDYDGNAIRFEDIQKFIAPY